MKRHMKVLLLLGSLVCALAAAPRPAYGADACAGGQPADTSKQEQSDAYCGIAVGPLDPLITAHLPDITEKGRGVVVQKVMKGSPAEQAGLRRYDILIRYGDQDVYSPEQLVKLVRHDEPGRKVSLTYVRRGKVKTADLTLAEMPAERGSAGRGAENGHDRDGADGGGKRWRGKERERQNDPMPWATFESLTISKLPDGQYKAQIEFRNEDRELLHRQYTGTRQEIREAIRKDNDLPKNEREHLLRSLDQQAPGDLTRILPKALRDFFDLDGEEDDWLRLDF